MEQHSGGGRKRRIIEEGRPRINAPVKQPPPRPMAISSLKPMKSLGRRTRSPRRPTHCASSSMLVGKRILLAQASALQLRC